MVKFKVALKDLLGKAYYRYNMGNTITNGTKGQTNKIRCTVTNIFGNPVENKEVTLYAQGTEVSTKTTDALGYVEWEMPLDNASLRLYKIDTHSTYTIVNNGGWKSTSITNGTLYYNEDLRLCHLRYSRSFNSATANTMYEWGQLIPSTYRPPFMVTGSGNRNGATVTIDSDGKLYGRFQTAFSSSTTFYYDVMWHY